MSRMRRQRDAIAPSLFPFLAVLLCTMGALVLLLMLIVAGAQSSAQEIAQKKHEQLEELDSQLQMARQSFNKQLHQGRIALEKQRLGLQHLENHIQEILVELEQLQRTAELAAEDADSNEYATDVTTKTISALELQLLEAKEQLKQKLDKPVGDKPIFAIIPYDGPNGTHRRPIYLECAEQGVLIQPEGVLIAGDDLEPPYGPGNPLDAALRTIRSQYAPANGAVTSTAYPLLIVRPNGIRTYAMARAAMSGWDDQFGYELIGEEIELTYPESEVGLKDKIVKALDLARQRQAALIMAMPQKYRSNPDRDLPPSGKSKIGLGGDGYGGGHGSLAEGSGTGQGDGSRGGFASGNNTTQGDPGSWLESRGAGFDSSAPTHFNSTGMDTTSLSSMADHIRPFSDPLSDAGLGSNHTLAGQSFFGAGGGQGALSGGNLELSSGGSMADGGSLASGGGQAMNMPGNQMAMPFASPNSSTAGSQTSSGQPASGAPPAGSPPVDADTLSLNSSLSLQNQGETSPPVAKRLGRNWAWSHGPPTQTPVVRSIRLQCLQDRWIVLPDSGSSGGQAITILFDTSPQQRAERLAKLIADRVDSWGFALTGGYWKPVLEVDVGPDAEWRYTQLKQLLDGSGLEVQRREVQRR